MVWQRAAEGTSLLELRQLLADTELPKGSKVRIEMDLKLPLAWAFDAAGAELAFRPFVPDGMTLIDVYGEGSKGIVEMEADPIWLIAMLAFIKAHWIAIAIAGFLLTAVIAFIVVLIKVAAAPTPFPAIVLALGIAALLLLTGREGKRKTAG